MAPRIESEEEKKLREVQTALDGHCSKHDINVLPGQKCYQCEEKIRMNKLILEGVACPKHREEYGSRHKEGPKCWGCQLEVDRKSPEGREPGIHDIYGRRDRPGIKFKDFSPEQQAAWLQGRNKIPRVLSDTDSHTAVKLVFAHLGKPRINSIMDQGGKRYHHRRLFWGVNLEGGVPLAKALVDAGIQEFGISTERWLTLRIPQYIQLRNILKKTK